MKVYITPHEEMLSPIDVTRSGQTVRPILLELKGNSVLGSILTPLWLGGPWYGRGSHGTLTLEEHCRGIRGANRQCFMALLSSFMKGDKVRLFP